MWMMMMMVMMMMMMMMKISFNIKLYPSLLEEKDIIVSRLTYRY